MKIELKNISFNERMSEETNCFVADLYINGKKIGYVKNDGRGGSTDIHALDKEFWSIIKQAEEYCISLGIVKCEEYNFEYQMTLEHKVDELFEEWLKAKEFKKLEKKFENNIVFGLPNGISYSMVHFKDKQKFKDIKKLHGSEQAYISILKLVNHVKPQLKNGEVILNNNLAEFGIVL